VVVGLGVGVSVVFASLLARILSFGFCAFLPVLGLSMPTLQVLFGIIGCQEVGSIQVSAIIPSPWIWCRGLFVKCLTEECKPFVFTDVGWSG
jgi:hypothetical protein